MEWWQQLYGFAIALAVGVIVALAGYFLNLNATRQEGKKNAKEQLKNAVRGILVELEANLKFAQQPFSGIMLPFTTEYWDDNKGAIAALPEEVQTAIYEAYIAGWELNAIVQSNLRLPYGTGYYDDQYKEKCKVIETKVSAAIEKLRNWLEANK